jgi:long-chain fatty acid transport protein
VSVPWGLSTDYADGWTGRYQALKSELKTINLTAAASWRASAQLALGFGLQMQRASVELSNAIDFGLAGYQLGLPGWFPGSQDGTVRVAGSDSALGAVASVLYQPQPGTRVGFTYRSKLTHSFNGEATFANVPAPFAAAFNNQGARSKLATPTTFSFHGMQDWEAWRFTADVTLWQFSSFKTLAVDFANPATPDLAQPQDWNNAAIYSFGAAYRCGKALTLRCGAAYNTTPVPSAERRTPRIPDSNRQWLSLGASWQPTANFDLHVGYVHLFFSDTTVNNTDAFTHNLRGEYKLSANIFSAQGTLRF